MLVFLAIAIASFVMLTASFIFGHDHEADHGHDMGHEVGEAAGEEPTISIFSMKVLATFAMGFGAAGAIAKEYGAGYGGASAWGVACGAGLAGLMYLVLGIFYKQQASSLFSTDSLIGSSGMVVVPIEQDSLGEVGISVLGQYNVYSARSKDGKPIPKGRTVRIVRAVGSHVIVDAEEGENR